MLCPPAPHSRGDLTIAFSNVCVYPNFSPLLSSWGLSSSTSSHSFIINALYLFSVQFFLLSENRDFQAYHSLACCAIHTYTVFTRSAFKVVYITPFCWSTKYPSQCLEKLSSFCGKHFPLLKVLCVSFRHALCSLSEQLLYQEEE